MVVENGKKTLFLHGKWVGETSLENQFSHIFDLARSKEAKCLSCARRIEIL